MASPFMPWNVELGKSIATGYYLLINYKTEELIAVVDGTSLMNFRTGAKSAVAAKYLAKKNFNLFDKSVVDRVL